MVHLFLFYISIHSFSRFSVYSTSYIILQNVANCHYKARGEVRQHEDHAVSNSFLRKVIFCTFLIVTADTAICIQIVLDMLCVEFANLVEM